MVEKLQHKKPNKNIKQDFLLLKYSLNNPTWSLGDNVTEDKNKVFCTCCW